MPFDSDAPTEVTTRDRLIMLRDFLAELPDERFSIRWAFTGGDAPISMNAFPECGTAACISGWAQLLFPADADDVFGLESHEACELFMPRGWDDDKAYHLYTRARAVAVLDHLINTGEVDWSVAFQERPA